MTTEPSRILSNLKLLPCGHSIGMKLLRKEFKIFDLLPVMKSNGICYYPAHEWGLKVNDIILEVEGKSIHSEQELHHLINETARNKEEVDIQIQRHGHILHKKVKPYLSPTTKDYRLGVRIKALDDGLGTLTFYDPLSKKFGALGHPLCRIPQEPLMKNTIVCSNVSSIRKGDHDHPGRKLGYLNNFNDFTGTLEQNTEVGIFGQIKGRISSPFFESPLPIASKDSIKRGQASIFTVVKDDEIEEFTISIYTVLSQVTGNMDLKIVIEDEPLLRLTGGIVCGMSGSPIVQNGKLIGAVSYLSTSNSSLGYGVSLENMLVESDLLGTLCN